MTWPEVLDVWSPPDGLRPCWFQNRQTLLDYCTSNYPDWCTDIEAAIKLLNSSLFPLGSALIWVQPQPQAKEAKPEPARLDLSEVSVDQVRERLAQLEMERQDNAQIMTDTSRINHAEKTEPQEEPWKLAYRAMKEKRQRLDVGGHGVIY